MSADLSDLVPAFRTKVDAALAQLAGENLVFVPFNTRRDPVTQAAYWRRSRSAAAVQQQIEALRAQGCRFMVACFEKAGPQKPGPWATNALPGLSWHQYGEAVDCYLEGADGHPNWQPRNYARFGQIGDAQGMWWGGHFGDNDHWQNRRTEPLDVFGSLKTIDDKLAADWPGLV